MWQFGKRVAQLWALVREDARLLWAALRHPGAPRWLRWGVAAIVAYLLLPLDLIPDLIPAVGLLDDLVLVPLAMRWLYRRLPDSLRADIERGRAAAGAPPSRSARPARPAPARHEGLPR